RSALARSEPARPAPARPAPARPAPARSGGAKEARARPHYMVQVVLAGGVDAVLTVDPKTSGPGIDPGYREQERLRGKRRMYGPLFKELLRHEGDLSLVHGVRVDTVSHPEGHLMLLKGRVTSSESAPFAGDQLGAALSGDAPIE